ncbi:MAG TPA: hypothetical protein VL134_04615, partial [Leptolyngbya sp.]|nr:hypothetical protein [Leptolyngbya sp.]
MPESPVAVFKLFGKPSGAMLFDDAAATVAEAWNIETTLTAENAPALRVKPEQFDRAESVLEAKGYRVLWNQSSPSIIAVSGHNATIYGQAAIVASKYLSKPSGETEKG